MVVMFIFRSSIAKTWQTGATLFLSISIDSDFILSWLYYNDVRGNDQIEQKLKDLLLVFTTIGSLAWLLIATDGFAYKVIYECLASFVACALDTIVPPLQTITHRYFPNADIRWLVERLRTAFPVYYYSPGRFSLFGIVFSDIALLPLTAIVDNYGERISPFGVGNIASSAYNLLVRLLDACDTLKEKRQVNEMVDKGFYHNAPITQVLQFNDDLIVTLSSVSWTIKLWNIDSEECLDTRKVAHASWVARLDDRHILVGQSVLPFIVIFHMSGGNFTPEGILPNPLFFDLGSIMNTFPGQELTEWMALEARLQTTEWMALEARLQTTVGRAHLWRVAIYNDNSLIGGTTYGKLFIWKKDNPEDEYAFVDVDAKHGLSFVDCVQRVGAAPLIVTINFQNRRRVWSVDGVDFGNHSLELSALERDAHDVTAVKILDSQTMVEGTTNGHVRKLYLNTNNVTWESRAHFQAVTTISVLDDGRILTGSIDGKALIWKRPSPLAVMMSLRNER